MNASAPTVGDAVEPSLAERMLGREIATLRANKDVWQKHAEANRARVRKQVGSLWQDVGTKTGVLISAGPSLEQSVDEIRALDRATHELVCVDMALPFLIAAGIRPDYVICADASAAIARTLEPGPWSGDDIALLLNVAVHPDTGKNWAGPIFWYAGMSNVYDKDLGKFMQDAHSEASGVTSFLVPGGNVASLGLSFLLGVRAVPKVLLFGHDFCWTDESRFYCGGYASDLAAERVRSERSDNAIVAMKDAAGKDVWTNASLQYFAAWFIDQMRKYPGAIVNRTPTSILPKEEPVC